MSLEGLGAIPVDNTNSSVNMGSSSTVTRQNDERMLSVDASQFEADGNYSIYLRNWFTSTAVFTVADIDSNFVTETNFAGAFNITSMPDGVVYSIIPVISLQSATTFINSYTNVINKTRNVVIFGLTNFSDQDKKIASGMNVELIGTTELLAINDSIVNPSGSMVLEHSLCGKLQKALNAKYKPTANYGQAISDFGNSMKDGFSSSLTDGIAQLKGSIGEMLTGIGLGNLASKLNGNSMPKENVDLTQVNAVQTSESQTYGENVNTSDTACIGSYAQPDTSINPAPVTPVTPEVPAEDKVSLEKTDEA